MVMIWREAGGKVFCFRNSTSCYYCYNHFSRVTDLDWQF